jgi:hypothetical protein
MFEWAREKLLMFKIYSLVLPALALVLALNAHFDEPALLRRQTALQKKIWRSEVNDMLYRKLMDERTDGLLVTDYQGVKYLPGFEARTKIADLESCAELSAGVALPGVRYLLLRVAQPSPIGDLLAAGTASGRFRRLGDAGGFSLWEVR